MTSGPARDRRRYAEDPERERERSRSYYAANRARLLTKARTARRRAAVHTSAAKGTRASDPRRPRGCKSRGLRPAVAAVVTEERGDDQRGDKDK
jgi:hypothetical protein